MDSLTDYGDVAAEVAAELAGVRDKLYAAGAAPEQIILDPGLGFAKNEAQNWELLQNLDVLQAMGHKVLVAASRKRFLGSLLTVAGKAAAPAGAGRRHRRHDRHQRLPRRLGRPRARRRPQPRRRQGRRPHRPGRSAPGHRPPAAPGNG